MHRPGGSGGAAVERPPRVRTVASFVSPGVVLVFPQSTRRFDDSGRPRSRAAGAPGAAAPGRSRPRPGVGLRDREPGLPGDGLRGGVRGTSRGPVRHLLQRRRHRLPEGQAALHRRRARGPLDRLHRLRAEPAHRQARAVEQRPGAAPHDLLLAAGGRQDGGRPRRQPAVRHALASGRTPTSSPAATSASTCQIDSWSINPTIAYQAGRPLLDRRRRRHPALELQALAPPERRPESVPGAHGRR